jgi:putative ABC transport system permease protein
VIALVLRSTVAMLFIGVVLGTALALLAGRAATSMLFGLNLSTLTIAIGLLTIIAVLASWLPALKASRLDPVAALRCE